MTNFELIDDYLTGKLSGAEKTAFEQRLSAEPELKAEVDLQRQIIEGVRQARVAELKTMLSKVPVGGSASLTTWLGGLAAVAIVGALSFWFLNDDSNVAQQKETPAQVEPVVPAPQGSDLSAPANQQIEEPPTKQAKAEPKAKVTEKPRAAEPNPVLTPKFDVVDPSTELTPDTNSAETDFESPGTRKESKPLEVKVVAVGRYENHYQLDKGVLILYGNFDKTLYEIIEIQGDEQHAFLYHQNRYYKLNGNSNAVQLLIPVTDPQLISKLRELRKK